MVPWGRGLCRSPCPHMPDCAPRRLRPPARLQLRLTRTDDGSADTPTGDGVAALVQRLAASLPLKQLREDAEETQG